MVIPLDYSKSYIPIVSFITLIDSYSRVSDCVMFTPLKLWIRLSVFTNTYIPAI